MSFSKNTFDLDALKQAIDQNASAIQLVPANEGKRLLEAEKVYSGERKDLNLYDKAEPSHEDMVKYAKDIEKAAMKVKGTKTTRSVTISQSKSHSLVMATNGIDLATSHSFYNAFANVIAEDKNGMQIDGESTSARHFTDLMNPTELGKKSGENAISRLSPDLPDTGEYTIILDQGAAQSFFASVFQAIDGTVIYQGASFLKDKLGQKVMSDDITIIDKPHIKKGIRSRDVDTAGVEAKEITFVKNGVLKAFNVTLSEARKLGIDPIGRENGRTNTSVVSGSKSPEDLMSDVKDGILVKGFNGGTVNVNSGVYSRQAYGLRIKNGKVTKQAVEGFVVSGNLKDMFMNVSVANDTPRHPTSSSFAAPTTRIDKITIAGK